MKHNILFAIVTSILCTIGLTQSVSAADGKVLFQDDFNRTELGGNWATNDKVRKVSGQSRLVDGVLEVSEDPKAGHAAVAKTVVPFRDAKVQVRFKLSEKAKFSVNFNDAKIKDRSWAGHVGTIGISHDQVTIQDQMNGSMKLEFRNKRDSIPKKEQWKMLAKHQGKFDVKLKSETWYQLEIQVSGDQVTVLIDDKQVGQFAAPGFAHENKGNAVALSIKGQPIMQFDDFKIIGQ